MASEPGRGSTFTIRLPAEVRELTPPAPTPAAREATSAGTSTVLVIDDDSAVRDLMSRFLGKEGFRVVAAAGGEEGLRLARELAPDVITLDVLMPERDGRDVLKDLRADPLTREIPIIVLTVVDKAEVPGGADAHLMKPIRKDRLLRTLEQVVPVTIDGR